MLKKKKKNAKEVGIKMEYNFNFYFRLYFNIKL